jgi:hypothetical protein
MQGSRRKSTAWWQQRFLFWSVAAMSETQYIVQAPQVSSDQDEIIEEADFHGGLTSPGEPTNAEPGSEQKIRVLIERARRREALFHPLDGVSKRWRPCSPNPSETPENHTESA